MDTIRYLLGKIVKIVAILFFIVFVMAAVGLVYPGFRPANLINFSFLEKDWLPTPKNRSLGNVSKNPDGTYGTLYKPGEPYGYSNADTNPYITYSYNGEMPTSTRVMTPYSERSRYLRNISLYEGAIISYGQTIYGDARSDLYRNGIFQILITDVSGKPIAGMYATNVGEWSVPNWPRWKAVVPVQLPHNVPCMLVFLFANGSRVIIPVRCY